LSIYNCSGNGIYNFNDGKLHNVKIVGKDVAGNAVILNFKVLSDSTKVLKESKRSSSGVKKINCFKEDEYSTDSFKIIFHKNSLYYNLDLIYSNSKKGKYKSYSKYHHIHNKYIPLHNKASIFIKPDSIPNNLRDKAIIAGLTRRGRIFSAGGEWKDGFIETKINNFGTYFVTVDSIVPIIRSLSLDKYKRLKNRKLNFRITDNLSGIEEYIGYIDDKWVLFKYDEKNNLISCNLSTEKVSKGKHFLVLWVKDYCGNIASYETNFIY
jgi:hypothetical protein